MGRLFGTDGVRGVANTELSPELAFQLGYYGAQVLAGHVEHRPRVLIGMDTRLSGPMLSQALCAGLCSAGADAYVCGVIPTPGIAFLTRDLQFDAGVVLSASHNPFEFNGIKFFNSSGFKLSDAIEDEIAARIAAHSDQVQKVSGAEVGTVHAYPQGQMHYLNHLRYAMGLDLSGQTIALDCAHGAAFDIAPKLFRQLGADVRVIGNTPDGQNINADCGSTHLEALQSFVLQEECALGLAFDGDADRLLAVDEKGRIVDGDQILAILAQYLRSKQKLSNDTVVATVMSNLGLKRYAEQENLRLEQTRVGDRYVLEAMQAGGHVLGGEQSGHVILLEYSTTGDGILSALALLKALRKSGQTLAAARDQIEIFPQILLPAHISNALKERVLEAQAVQAAIAEVEGKLGDTGRVLVRASGTEPMIRVMLEGRNEEEIRNLAEYLVSVVLKVAEQFTATEVA